MNRQPKPSQADLRAAADRGIADVIAPRLRVLFVGINPG
ncbi:MAG TPA: mismatch-specific DNA-glycosylase, partial [Chloroflexi bacterium]|nr:mismatch-specific DNA-glycosylase [Chloroflexota bacterium]